MKKILVLTIAALLIMCAPAYAIIVMDGTQTYMLTLTESASVVHILTPPTDTKAYTGPDPAVPKATFHSNITFSGDDGSGYTPRQLRIAFADTDPATQWTLGSWRLDSGNASLVNTGLDPFVLVAPPAGGDTMTPGLDYVLADDGGIAPVTGNVGGTLDIDWDVYLIAFYTGAKIFSVDTNVTLQIN